MPVDLGKGTDADYDVMILFLAVVIIDNDRGIPTK